MDLIQQLEETRDQTLRFFALDDGDLARTYATGKWSVRFILLHLADSETVLFDRIRRVLSEPRQVLWVFDQDAWAEGLDYSRVPLDISCRVYESVRNAVIYYAGLYYEQKTALDVPTQRELSGVRRSAPTHYGALALIGLGGLFAGVTGPPLSTFIPRGPP